MMPQASYTGLEALLTPEESVLVLIDHQPFQFANLHSHEPQSIVANVVALAKGAKASGSLPYSRRYWRRAAGISSGGCKTYFLTRSQSIALLSTRGRTQNLWKR